MGKVISVWSSTKKNGKTVFLYMLANHLSGILCKDLRMLVGCVNLNYGNLMGMFEIDGQEFNLEDIVNLKIHPDNEFNLLNALAKKENMYFIGSKKTSSTYANRHMRIYENLLEEFRKAFDLVLFDVISGSENSLTNMIVDKSDSVLNIINQDKESLDMHPFVTGKDIAYVISRYREIYPNQKELASMYGLKNVFTLPACDDLQEMKNRGKLEFYTEHDTDYNRSVRKISEFLAGELALELSHDPGREKKRKGMFGGLLGGMA